MPPPTPAERLQPPVSRNHDQILSSSPGFGTPAYPIVSRPARIAQPFAPKPNNTVTPSVLPILLPPQTLRPVAFRTLTKKHNLTLTSSGLGLLSTFVGRFCGSGWREEGLAERVLDEIAKVWKRSGGGVLIEDGPEKKLSTILKSLEPCMSAGRIDVGRLSRTNSNLSGGSLSRQNSLDVRPIASREDSQSSLGFSNLEVQDEADDDLEMLAKQDARTYMTYVSARQQPRLTFSTTKKSFEPISTPPSLFPPITHKIAMFRNRYHLVHQRLMRMEHFQTPSFSISRGPPSFSKTASNVASMQQAYKITPISNLLGRAGSSHLLLGMLANTPTGDLALTDLSGSVVLDMSAVSAVPKDGSWFCPGMIVLIQGLYEEDGSNNSNLGGAAGIGGQIKGKFVSMIISGPPAERRHVSLGIGKGSRSEANGVGTSTGFGWVDFMGTGSEKAAGPRMRRIQHKLLGDQSPSADDQTPSKRTKVIIIGECNLDSPRTLDAIRAILSEYNSSGEAADRPLSVVLMGNFVSAASCAGSSVGGDSVEYKEHFDALASTLSEFPYLLANCTFMFVPGDNDPWPSAFSAGASVAIPRESIPDIFTSRIRRAIAAANTEAGKKDGEEGGQAIWATNPARLSLFGPVDELVFFRDDMTGRLRRTAVKLPKAPEDGEDDGAPAEPQHEDNHNDFNAIDLDDPISGDPDIAEATSHQPNTTTTNIPKSTTSTITLATPSARNLTKTLLDQSHLSPFPLHKRPVFWDHAGSLSLYPLPTALILCDAETAPFSLTYEGCHVMNAGRVLDEWGMRKGRAVWCEYDVRDRRGCVREVRF